MPLPFNPPIDAPGNQDYPEMHIWPCLGRNYRQCLIVNFLNRPDPVTARDA